MEAHNDLTIEITNDEIVVGISVTRGQSKTPVNHKITQALGTSPAPEIDMLCKAVTSLINRCRGWSHYAHSPCSWDTRRTFWREGCVLLPRGWLQRARLKGGQLELLRIDLSHGHNATKTVVALPEPDKVMGPLMMKIAYFFISRHTGKEIREILRRRSELIDRILTAIDATPPAKKATS